MATSTITTAADTALRDFDSAFASIVRQLHSAAVQAIEPVPAAPSPTHAPEPTTDVEVNVELFQRALESITDNPETHQQNVWARRSETGDIIGCLAYHVSRLTGHTVRWSNSPWTGLPRYESGYVIADNSTDVIPMFTAARMALGLSHAQANLLFHPGNDTHELWEMAGKFTNGQVTRKENVPA